MIAKIFKFKELEDRAEDLYHNQSKKREKMQREKTRGTTKEIQYPTNRDTRKRKFKRKKNIKELSNK